MPYFTHLGRSSRRGFAVQLAIAGSVLVASELAAQTKADAKSSEKARVIISVDGKSSLAYLPLTIAQQLGYFSDEGLDVQINDLPDATSASQALINGTADVCSGAFDRTLQSPSRSQIFKAFVLQGRTPQLAFGVSSRSLPYGRMAELKSKKLGVTALDSMSTVMIKLLLQRDGVNIQEVGFVPVGTAAGAVNALRSGQIDALCNTDPLMTVLEQKGDIKVIHDARSLKGTSELFGGVIPSACLYAPLEFTQKHPQTCQALTNAIVHSLKWLQTAGPGDIINTVPASYLLGDRALYLAAFNKMRESISLDGMVPDQGALAALRVLGRYDASLLAANADVGRSYTNEFVRRAKRRFQA
jgi:NitT/TauT family transport system substrate-binding protein